MQQMEPDVDNQLSPQSGQETLKLTVPTFCGRRTITALYKPTEGQISMIPTNPV